MDLLFFPIWESTVVIQVTDFIAYFCCFNVDVTEPNQKQQQCWYAVFFIVRD